MISKIVVLSSHIVMGIGNDRQDSAKHIRASDKNTQRENWPLLLPRMYNVPRKNLICHYQEMVGVVRRTVVL